MKEKNSIEKIHISLINPNAGQPRKYFDKKGLKILAKSFGNRKDVDYPIIVISISKRRYMIVDGERRYRAAKIAKLEEISCHIRHDIHSNDVYLVSARANICRENMSPI